VSGRRGKRGLGGRSTAVRRPAFVFGTVFPAYSPGVDMYFGADFATASAQEEEFLTGTPAMPVTDRVLATVLFTDIVSSTEQLSALGDQAWHARLDRHDAMCAPSSNGFAAVRSKRRETASSRRSMGRRVQ